MYIADSGLACHLLGIDTAAELAKSPFLGPLFEGFLASEVMKGQIHGGGRRELYYFRDQQGLEVDFLVPRRGGRLSLVECKAGKTVTPAMAASMRRLAETLRKKRPRHPQADMFLVHQPRVAGPMTTAVSPGVQALPWRTFLEELFSTRTDS